MQRFLLSRFLPPLEDLQSGQRAREHVLAVCPAVAAAVIVEALAALQAEMPLAHQSLHVFGRRVAFPAHRLGEVAAGVIQDVVAAIVDELDHPDRREAQPDRKSTRLNSSHLVISYAVFCLKKKKTTQQTRRISKIS